MEQVKSLFNLENIKELSIKIYDWMQIALDTLFGNISYHPIRDLLSNPWFWIILLFLLVLGLIFRRR